MKATLIETPNGERLVILPEAEYRQLIAAAEGRKDATEVVVPAQVANRIFAGENPIRVYREWRDETALHLAMLCDLSPGHISDLERGRRRPTEEVRQRIARVLGVHPDDLIPANMD
jgi:DNA-binding XRE family transcriptional regulator